MIGIRYWRPESRVVSLSKLGGASLHPTPVYSIVANILIGVILLRLVAVDASFGAITGMYLLLAGLTRFVEEAFRGGPQTPNIRGLPIYQWAAVMSLLAGAVTMTLEPGLRANWAWSWDLLRFGAGLCIGLIVAVAMGLDFPKSEKRFARLTPD